MAQGQTANSPPPLFSSRPRTAQAKTPSPITTTTTSARPSRPPTAAASSSGRRSTTLTITTPTATDDKPTVASNLRFPGQVEDAETGLYYNWHRYYDPELGRYVTADPIGLVGGVNLYAYVGGNPVNWLDPYGLVKAPGTGESFIPIWGSARQAAHDFECGNYGWAVFNTGMAALDIFGARTLNKAGVKTGRHTWRATRRWLGKTGFAQKFQHVHHAFWPQKKINNGNSWFFNQPWNLIPLTPPPGVHPGLWHMMVEGRTPGLNGFQRWWHGIPDWFKAAEVLAADKGANLPREDCACEG